VRSYLYKSSVKHQQLGSIDYFKIQLRLFLSAQDIITRDLQRYAYGSDASFYRLVPKLVLRLNNQEQVVKVIKLADKLKVAITFRAAGTSLSGQAITDSVLILLSSHWQQVEIIENGEKIKLQPGVIGAKANRALLPYARKIGPDPASINSCKIGGIAANNASGMCCGVKNNSYHTLAAIKLIFADGSVLDSADSYSREQFLNSHQTHIKELLNLADKIKKNAKLLSRVQHKYRLKNTTGYGINALIDFTDPIDIITHLMIGSEGTLAFIADITYQTQVIKPFKATGLYLFDNIQISCSLVTQLAKEPIDAVEILDDRALNSVALQLNQLLDFTAAKNNDAALLIEFSADSEAELTEIQGKLEQKIADFQAHLLPSKGFTQDISVINQLWKIRKGMFPAVGANRKTGTTVVIEDVALPLDKLAVGVEQLHQLFKQFGYDEAIIFGHALAGNLHFVFTQSFESKKEISRYHDFMAAVSQMVAVDYQGSLKAEHGTGRNMAPFVELEWGSDLYQIMLQIKQLFDPKGIFNPGVIINDDKNCHITNLKQLPAADELIDKCIECGFCEVVCPSTNLTLTPRQRIVLWRHIKALKTLEQQQKLTSAQALELKNIQIDYQYFAIDSCAATGLCGQACPVGIDTGAFIKSLRADSANNNKSTKKVAQLLANNLSAVSTVAKFGLNSINLLNNIVGNNVCYKSFSAINHLTNNRVPKWYPAWPTGAKKHTLNNTNFSEKVIYIPSCANRIFAADTHAKDQRPLIQVLHSLLSKAKIQVVIPEGIDNFCCGMPWQSKGLTDIAKQKRSAFIELMRNTSLQGKWPIITDASPCAFTINVNGDKSEQNLTLFEASEYIAKYVLDKLTIKKSNASFMLHKTCSSIKTDGGIYLEQIAHACSDNIIVPEDVYCCGFAGDKGFYLPELNKNALQALPAQIPQHCSRGISNSRTCEIGLSEHSKISYQSFLYLLDEVSVS
jgi:D-lactate dehydrogenase